MHSKWDDLKSFTYPKRVLVHVCVRARSPSQRDPKGCPVWTHGACLINSIYSRFSADTNIEASIQGFSARCVVGSAADLRCVPCFHALSSGKHGQTSPHQKKKKKNPLLSSVKPQEWRHPAAGFIQPHSWLLLQAALLYAHSSSRRAARWTLWNTDWFVAGRQHTDNHNFYYSAWNESTGPKIRPVAAWPIACRAITTLLNCCVLLHHNVIFTWQNAALHMQRIRA